MIEAAGLDHRAVAADKQIIGDFGHKFFVRLAVFIQDRQAFNAAFKLKRFSWQNPLRSDVTQRFQTGNGSEQPDRRTPQVFPALARSPPRRLVAFAAHRAPKSLTISGRFQEDVIATPTPVAEIHCFNAAHSWLGGKRSAEVMPPEADRPMDHVVVALVKQFKVLTRDSGGQSEG
ncbi:hypothetical protein OEW28_10825 [Defluviimonas sp. WL0002]|uniref:Uncharacterized protein n=1 Tax=Albidovulum marisflavi TaxID=2984159 RepID=A0ABT2ZDA2_9RHOB|nr:hypothetical protein [Defluviimonas sp. WL0002]MCV2869120.1 hypothetical protein [Defluviimonas sp. WL0002]